MAIVECGHAKLDRRDLPGARQPVFASEGVVRWNPYAEGYPDER